MKRKDERRREKRIALDHARIDIHQKKTQIHRELRGMIFDINHLGARFLSEKRYTRKSLLYISLLLPNGVSLSDIFSKVIRCEKIEGRFYTAVEFKEIDHYQKSLLDDYIRVMKLWDRNIKKHFKS